MKLVESDGSVPVGLHSVLEANMICLGKLYPGYIWVAVTIR